MGRPSSPDRQGTERGVTAQGRRESGREKRRGQDVSGAISIILENAVKSAAGRMESLEPDPFVRIGFVQLSQETAVSVEMCRTISQGRPRRLGQNNDKI